MNIMHIHVDDVDVFQDADWHVLDSFVKSSKTECNVLCVGISKTINDEFMSDFPNVSYILCPATCIDHIVTTRNVKVLSLIPSLIHHISASAEFTLFLILALLRRGLSVFKEEKVIGNDLSEKTVGFIGYGRIGSKVAEYLKPLGCKIIWNDVGYGCTKLEVLRNSDIVVLSMTADRKYTNFINYDDFNQMRDSSYFINISRGFLVNDKALLNALQSKKIYGAALDVVEDISVYTKYREQHDNLIITSHIAGSTVESRKKACNFVIQLLKDQECQS